MRDLIRSAEQTAWYNYNVVESIMSMPFGTLVDKSGKTKKVEEWTSEVRNAKINKQFLLDICDKALKIAIAVAIVSVYAFEAITFVYVFLALYLTTIANPFMRRIDKEFGEQAILRGQKFWQNGPTFKQFIPRDLDIVKAEISKLSLREDPLDDRGLKLLGPDIDKLMNPLFEPYYAKAFNYKKKHHPEVLASAIGKMATGIYIDKKSIIFERGEVGFYMTTLYDLAQNYLNADHHPLMNPPPKPTLLSRILSCCKSKKSGLTHAQLAATLD